METKQLKTIFVFRLHKSIDGGCAEDIIEVFANHKDAVDYFNLCLKEVRDTFQFEKDGRFDIYEGQDSIRFKNWDDDTTIALSVERFKVNYLPVKKVKEI